MTTTAAPSTVCVACEERLRSADVIVSCVACRARHHAACWSETASCSRCGAEESRVARWKRKQKKRAPKARKRSGPPPAVEAFHAEAADRIGARVGRRGIQAWVRSGSPWVIGIAAVCLWLGLGTSVAVLASGTKRVGGSRLMAEVAKVGGLFGSGVAFLLLAPIGYAAARRSGGFETPADPNQIDPDAVVGVIRAELTSQAAVGVAAGVSLLAAGGIAFALVPSGYALVKLGVAGGVALSGVGLVVWGARRLTVLNGEVLDLLEREPGRVTAEASDAVGFGGRAQRAFDLRLPSGEGARVVVPAALGPGIERYLES